jgi:iron complex transport system substrate-binding protein
VADPFQVNRRQFFSGAAGLSAALVGASLLPGFNNPSRVAAADSEFPLDLTSCGFTSTLAEPPSRVVVAEPNMAGTMVALGLSDYVIQAGQVSKGVEDPTLQAGVLALPLAKDFPSREILTSLDPDFVIAPSAGYFSPDYGFATREELKEAGIATWLPSVFCAQDNPDASDAEKQTLLASSAEDWFTIFADLGQLFGV